MGNVTDQGRHFTLKNDAGVQLANGGLLEHYELAVCTYGALNENADNAILICHALTGNQFVSGTDPSTGKPGWWSQYVGPGKAIDTNRFFVVGVNNLGGCSGSTGPSSINPATGSAYLNDFPSLRVRDWVATQHWLMTQLNIKKWYAVVGGSLGGMQAMRWCVDFPEAVERCVVIASATSLTAQNIAFNELARSAISKDPRFADGKYASQNTLPEDGLSLARMIGHVTYLSGTGMNAKFGRSLQRGSFELGNSDAVQFEVESYLQYQGAKFATRFDANSYILFTRVLDYFDLGRDFGGDVSKAFTQCDARFLVIGFSTDWRFSAQRSEEITDALIRATRHVSYACIDSEHGHDAFLIANTRYEALLRSFIEGEPKHG
ncbi:MAG: homoserine O-acetyltransferase [Gammaproteobacteria bacterium]|nr:homoserine O-acetyltransferase [Gammaproteobacteria bacterium]